jgi:hydroxylaminobenzene mutase
MAYGAVYGGAALPAYPPPGAGPAPWGYLAPVAARPRPSSAAGWSLALGIVGALTAPLLGGIVPGTLAVVLAAAARREIVESEGWLTGTGRLAAGRVLGWIAIWVAITMAVAMLTQWLVGLGDAAVQPTYPGNVE